MGHLFRAHNQDIMLCIPSVEFTFPPRSATFVFPIFKEALSPKGSNLGTIFDFCQCPYLIVYFLFPELSYRFPNAPP